MTVFDRLDHHLVSHIPKGRSHRIFDWADQVVPRPFGRAKLDFFVPILRPLIDSGMLVCASFIDFSALFPIPFYLKHRTRENPNTHVSSGAHYSDARILNNLIFGEIWFHSSETRLNLLDFLIQEKDYPAQRLLRITIDSVEAAATAVHEACSARASFDYYDMFTYFTRVTIVLRAQITNDPDYLTSWLERSRYWWQRQRRWYKKSIDRK